MVAVQLFWRCLPLSGVGWWTYLFVVVFMSLSTFECLFHVLFGYEFPTPIDVLDLSVRLSRIYR